MARFSLDKVYDNARADLQKLVPINARRVLDVGCGTGRLGRALKEQQSDRLIVGIEPSRDAAHEAGHWLDTVLHPDDAEQFLVQHKDYFDCVIYGDVLEHLVDPWTTVAQQCSSLRPAGTAIATCPNLRFWRIWITMLNGTWHYQEHGLFDVGHIRWFTPQLLRQLFIAGGYSNVVLPRHSLLGKSGQFNRFTGGRYYELLASDILVVATK